MRSRAPGGWSDDRWEQSKHFVGITYAAGHRVGELLSQAEFQVFRRDRNHPDGKRPVTEDDPPEGDRIVKPYDLVHVLEKPNPEDSFGDIMYRHWQQMLLTGRSLTWMVPNAAGAVVEMYSVPTAIAIPQAVINPEYPDGFYRIQPVYPYGPFSSYPTPSSAVGAPIPAQWMLDIKYPHPLLRYDGYSPLTAIRLHLDEVESIDRSRWYSMKRVTKPSAVLNFDEMEGAGMLPEPEIDRIHAEWEASFQGPENYGKLIVGTPGGKFEPWGANPADMEFQQGWEQLVSFAMATFGITKPAAGMTDTSSYATLFAALKQLYWLTIDPFCNRIGQRYTRRLAPFYGDDLIVEVRAKRIDDHEISATKVDKLLTLKGMPKSVIRTALKLLDLPVDTNLIEELSAAGEQQPGMGMPGMPGEQPSQQPGANGGESELALGPLPEEEMDAARPENTLGEGSLGPRKRLAKTIKVKSMYDRVREACCNGHH